MIRLNNRKYNELRPLNIKIDVNKYAEGSCLISLGNTHVMCTASIINKVPFFIKGSSQGWITCEYGMLPRSTVDRMEREAVKGKQSGRTHEIQRLIGRSLRSITNLEELGERQVKIDCDVLQADGGTRTAAISGSYVALFIALQRLVKQKIIKNMPLKEEVAAISCGVLKGKPILDIDYEEDSESETDSNFVLTSSGKIIEMQISSDKEPTTEKLTLELLELAKIGVQQIIIEQKKVLSII